MRAIIFSLLILVTLSTATAQQPVAVDSVKNFVGKRKIKVCSEIIGVKRFDSALNLMLGDRRFSSPLTIVIFKRNFSNFNSVHLGFVNEDAALPDELSSYPCFTGKVTMINGHPHMILKDESQIHFTVKEFD